MSEQISQQVSSRKNHAGLFKKGVSGNPAGRAKGIEARARQYTEEAIQVLVDALKNKDKRIAVAAATILLDRGWGKPKQMVEDANGANTLQFMHLVAARAFSEQLNNNRNDGRILDVDANGNTNTSVSTVTDLMAPALE